MLMTDLEAIGLFTIISRDQMKEVIQEQEFQMSGMVDPDKAVSWAAYSRRAMLAGSFMEMNGAFA